MRHEELERSRLVRERARRKGGEKRGRGEGKGKKEEGRRKKGGKGAYKTAAVRARRRAAVESIPDPI